jgi:hypothetical protein
MCFASADIGTLISISFPTNFIVLIVRGALPNFLISSVPRIINIFFCIVDIGRCIVIDTGLILLNIVASWLSGFEQKIDWELDCF